MTARAIPAHLEHEVITRHLEGHSLRTISTWLKESQRVLASREAVSSLLVHYGVDPESLSLSEVARQLGERTDDLTTQLFECLGHYRQLVEDCMKPEPPKHARTALQAAKAWAQLLMWSLRAAGAQLQVKPTPYVEKQVRLRDMAKAIDGNRQEAASAPKSAPPMASVPTPSTPPRNQPCICGSGMKWKKCCGSPMKLPAHPDSFATLSG